MKVPVVHAKDFTSFQEGIKRYQAAMAGFPDRVPVFAQLHEFAMNELGVGAQEFYSNAELLVTGTLEIHQKYGIDVPLFDYDVYNIEAGGKNGRLLIYLCNLGATTPPQNVTAAVEAVRQYGGYN